MQETARPRTADDARLGADMLAERAHMLLEQDYDGPLDEVAADMHNASLEAVACALLAIEARLDVLARVMPR